MIKLCDFTLVFSFLFCFWSLNYIAPKKCITFDHYLLLCTYYVQETAILSRLKEQKGVAVTTLPAFLLAGGMGYVIFPP